MLPIPARLAREPIDRARIQQDGVPSPSCLFPAAQAHEAGRKEGDAEDLAVDGSVPVPAYARAWRVPVDERLDEDAFIRPDPSGDPPQKIEHEVRPGIRRPHPPLRQVMAAPEGGDMPETLIAPVS